MTETNFPSKEEIRERLVALTRDLILIPSIPSQPEDIDRGMKLVRNHLESLDNLLITEFSPDGNPSLIALPKNISKPEILLCGHIDVISHPDLKSYRSRIENGRIYGPGAGDMKGPLAILLEVFREMHTKNPECSLGLMVTSDEELGGETGVHHLVEKVGICCDTVMIPDGGSLTEIPLEEKGVLHLKLHASGHSAHAARPWLGENPLEKLTLKLNEILEYFREFQEKDTNWHPTCSLTIISTPNETVNRIPHEAEAVLDIRFTPPHTLKEILNKVQEIAGEGILTEIIISAEPSHLSPDPLFLKVTEEVTGITPKLIKEDGGSDARFFCNKNISVIVSRPVMGSIHAEDEWIDIDSMVTFYYIYKKYLKKKLAPAQ